ncbi:MAG TPA: non-ribosomal peptide synthetase, partial [Anaerolineae bacterium]
DKSRTYGPEWREGNVYLQGYKATPTRPYKHAVEPVAHKVAAKIGNNGRNVVTPSVEAQLIQIIADMLDVSPAQIDPDMNMMDLNLDSLKMIALSERVNNYFQIQTMPPDFFLFNDLRELVDFIRESKHTSLSPSSPARSPLVPIRSLGNRPPFFCVHPWAGMVYPYFDLAHELGPDQPFYGLQAVGLYQAPHRSIEEMAAHYLEALQTVQPEPPYLLGGWSSGGLIAFEMAQQLRRSGREVALVALIDTPASTHTGFLSTAKFLVSGVLPYIWPYIDDYVRLMSASGGNGHSMIRTITAELYSFTSSQSTARRILRIVRTTMAASSKYQAQSYPDRLTLFRTQNQSVPDDEVQTLGWNKLAANGVEVHHLPGQHFDILRKPQVQVLAGRLRVCIDRVQADQADVIVR